MRVKQDANWQKEVGLRLGATLVALGVRDADVARLLEINPQRWSNYANGHRPISVDLAIALCDRYGLTLDWIYRGRIDGLPVALADKLRPAPTYSSIIPIQKLKPGGR